MPEPKRPIAHPPETLEGWYQFTQVFTVDRREWRSLPTGERGTIRKRAVATLSALQEQGAGEEEDATRGGWTAFVDLAGSSADLMIIHFRPTLDAISAAQSALRNDPIFDYFDIEYSFLSVTEAGLYHLTAQLAREASEAGAEMSDDAYQALVAARAKAEAANPHVKRRLYPQLPPDLPYVCFYPMSKRRSAGQNWYALSLEDRSRLMLAHGATGRKYAGRVVQVISGAIGLDAWEWGVTLFAGDPIDFKKLLTDMRFDEVSAEYAEFGDFFVGKVVRPDEWVGAAG